eukprot:TRINITY_DN10362_c0_g1_i3.p1 TRINITY_DN10362_c0_g1~~TRINITY_DN10362_c0_g1_i3.p1  ORF type:complete len:224 (-),score=107.28 TRINITY_DN10362_c0_g1_i3:112-783(-)
MVLTQQLGDLHLSPVQQAILVGLGLEHKTVEKLTEQLELPASQLLALFNRSVRKISTVLRGILEQDIEARLEKGGGVGSVALPSLDQELENGAAEEEEKQREKAKNIFINQDLQAYAVKGSEGEWAAALANGKSTNMLSIKTGEKRAGDSQHNNTEAILKKQKKENQEPNSKKKKKKKDKDNEKDVDTSEHPETEEPVNPGKKKKSAKKKLLSYASKKLTFPH